MAMGNDGCRWAEPRLPLHAGGELLGLDRRRVERHLLSCAGCRNRLESLNSTLNLLHSAAQMPLDRLEPSTSVWPLVAQQIRESRHTVNQSTWSLPFHLPLLGRSWGMRTALAASLLMVFGAGLYQFQAQSPLVVRPWPPAIVLRPIQMPKVAQPLLTVSPEFTAAPPVTETAALDEPADDTFDEADDLDTESDDNSAPVGTAN